MLLSVDIGTTNLKLGLFERSGQPVCIRRTAYQQSDAATDEDPLAWWNAFLILLRGLPISGVEAVAVSGHGPTIVAIDTGGNPLGAAHSWRGPETPVRFVSPSFFIPKILAWRARFPALYEKAALFLPCPEYLSWRLTGQAAAFSPHASFDWLIWTDVTRAAAEIEPHLLPAIARTGSLLGRVSGLAAQQTGLPLDCPVFAGGPDFLLSLLGTATLSEAALCDRAGTSEALNLCTGSVAGGEYIRVVPHFLPDFNNHAIMLSQTGALFEQYRSSIGWSAGRLAELANSMAGKELLEMPAQVVMKPAKSATQLFDWSTCLQHAGEQGFDPTTVGTALLRGLLCALKEATDLHRSAGHRLHTLTVCGGMATNPAWNQLKADITGLRVRMPRTTDAELTGLAMLCSVGLGDSASVRDAADCFVHFEAQFEPRVAEQTRLQEVYTHFLER